MKQKVTNRLHISSSTRWCFVFLNLNLINFTFQLQTIKNTGFLKQIIKAKIMKETLSKMCNCATERV
jgi:hypothetical protein